MTEYLRNNQSALRACILYEFVEGKPVFEAFKNMCKRIDDDVISYAYFEFWFMRFSKGKFNLNYNKSMAPKTRSLSDMPIHIIERIFDKLDFMDRFMVRKVSKNFRILSDTFISECEEISILFRNNATIISFDDKTISYTNGEWPFRTERNNCFVKCEERKIKIIDENHLELALDDVASVLKNPKLKLKNLSMENKSENFMEKVKAKFKSLTLNQPIYVKNFKIITQYSKEEMAILPYLKERSLKTIRLEMKDSQKKLSGNGIWRRMRRIGELEQCRKAKMLTMETNHDLNSFPIENFSNLPRFTVHFVLEIEMEVKEVTEFLMILLKFTELELCYLKFRSEIPVDSIKRKFSRYKVPNEPNIRRFKVPKSTKFYEMRLSGNHEIRIEREREIIEI